MEILAALGEIGRETGRERDIQRLPAGVVSPGGAAGHPNAAETSEEGAGKCWSNEPIERGRGEVAPLKRRSGSMGSNEGLNWFRVAERREAVESARWREVEFCCRKSMLPLQDPYDPLRRRVPIGSRPGESFLGKEWCSLGRREPMGGSPSWGSVLPRCLVNGVKLLEKSRTNLRPPFRWGGVFSS